jgi:hypothetical protein
MSGRGGGQWKDMALAEMRAAVRVLFSDESLKAAAQPSLSASQQERLAQLSHTGGERTLTMFLLKDLHLVNQEDDQKLASPESSLV